MKEESYQKQDTKEYEDTLDYLAREGINNAGINKGEINRIGTLLATIKHSKKQIKIYEIESNITHYNEEITRELDFFINKRKGHLKILLDNFKEESLFSEFVKENHSKYNMQINLTNRKYLSEDRVEGYFILGDETGFALSFYRNKEPEIRTLFNFKGKKFSRHLNQFFEETFNDIRDSYPLKILEKIA